MPAKTKADLHRRNPAAATRVRVASALPPLCPAKAYLDKSTGRRFEILFVRTPEGSFKGYRIDDDVARAEAATVGAIERKLARMGRSAIHNGVNQAATEDADDLRVARARSREPLIPLSELRRKYGRK